MIRICEAAGTDMKDLLLRGEKQAEIEETVRNIIADVRERGDEALRDYALKFDGAAPRELEVSRDEIDAAYESVDPALIATMEKAAANIRAYHEKQLDRGFRLEKSRGVILGQRVTPIEKVGIYIPGGSASYPSTVLMNAIPAAIAGCDEIVMVSPPSRGGTIAPVILAAARMAGITRVFKTGGAQGIAALAYGTGTVPRVYKITGPGNAYVAEAKRQVFGAVDIDMIAGPSEILVIADSGSRASHVAADMLSQAEHDRMAAAVLITDSRKLAEETAEEIEKQLPLLEREEIARASIEENGRIILVTGIGEALDIANELAPEHLELCLDDPFAWLDKVRTAGSVFLGRYCPEPLGDYMAGPNHTLPTEGRARFSSALGVDDYVKKSQYTWYDREAFREIYEDIDRFARAEGLTAHARAASIRFSGD